MILNKNKKKYSKPSLRIAERNNRRRKFYFYIKILLFLIFIVGAIFLFRADFLKVKKIEIYGLVTIQEDEIINKVKNLIEGNVFFIFPRSNMVLIDDDKIVNSIKSINNRIETVDIDTKINNILKINIKERESGYIWCSFAYDCFLMDISGLIFDTSAKSEKDGKLVFYGRIRTDPIMQKFASKEELDLFAKLSQILKENKINVLSINTDQFDKTYLITDIGDIILNLEDKEILKSIDNVLVLIENHQSKNPNTLFNYIDARFGNKLFYKLKQ